MIWSHLRYKGEKIDFEILNFKTLAELLRPPVVWKLKNFYSFYQMVISSAKINALMYVVEKFSMGIASCTWSFRLVIDPVPKCVLLRKSAFFLNICFCLKKMRTLCLKKCGPFVFKINADLLCLKKMRTFFRTKMRTRGAKDRCFWTITGNDVINSHSNYHFRPRK